MHSDWRVNLANRLCNISENLTAMGIEYADMSHVFDRAGNGLVGDMRGVGLFALDGNIAHVHYMMNPTTRGPEKLRLVRRMIDMLFTEEPIVAIVGEIAASHAASRMFVRALGFAPAGHSTFPDGRSSEKYILERNQWVSLAVS